MTKLNCDGIRQTLSIGATLIDVRSADEYSKGCLPNAKNIPLSILPIVAHERLGKDGTYFIYCQAGARAVMAEKILANMGFTNVTNIGGMQHYQDCA